MSEVGSTAENSVESSVGSGVGTQVPLEVLERRLTSRAADLAAAQAEWMGWLAEYDKRRGWAEWGCLGPAHWLSWKCGLSPSAARERVRVAGALADLPLVQGAFRAGRLSYSKVQALTRVANEFNEADLVDMALNATGAQLARICAGYRRSATTVSAAADAFASRAVTSRSHHDGSTSITMRVPDADASQALAHLDVLASRIIDDAVEASASDACAQASLTRREAIAERNGIAAVRADAAIALLTGHGSDLETDGDEVADIEPTPADVTMIIDADQAQTAAQSQAPTEPDTCAQVSERIDVTVSGSAVAEPVAHRLLCDARITALIESADTGPLAVGRSTRVISRRLRRALQRRDTGACRFHGCHATKRLHAHHIIHWTNGGPTDLDNLVSLCHFHHHLVHEGGWTITGSPGNTVDPLAFMRPDRTPSDSTPERLRAGVQSIEPNNWRTVTGTSAALAISPLQPADAGPFDLAWTTTVLHHNEQMRRIEAERTN